jgi:hypothetical protein
MSRLDSRVATLEQAGRPSIQRWHCLRRYDGETDAQAVAAYEALNGQIVDDSSALRVFISKPGERPGCSRL